MADRPTAAGSCSSAPATTTTTSPTRPDFPGIEYFTGDGRAPAVLARGPRLLGQAGRGDRQRRHRDQPDPGAGRQGRPRDHAAALTDVHDVDAAVNPVVHVIRKVCRAGSLTRRPPAQRRAFTVLRTVLPRRRRGSAARLIRSGAKRQLPDGYPVDVHFKPRYNPWDQRMCLVLDGDLFRRRSAPGRLDVVTDHIDHFDATGIVLQSGRPDRRRHHRHRHRSAAAGPRRHRAERRRAARSTPPTGSSTRSTCSRTSPNMAWCIGYTNASWTLRADMTARAVAKLLAYMDSHGYTHAYPHLGVGRCRRSRPGTSRPTTSNARCTRCPSPVPSGRGTSGTTTCWTPIDHRFDRIEESMVFGRAHDRGTVNST